MKRDCSTCAYKEGSCYPSTTILDKDKTCKSYEPDYEEYIADLEKENANLKDVIEGYKKIVKWCDKCDKLADLEKEIAELKEFYENEYFQIADRTADEKIKELEKHQVEVTIDDYSPYDENTWGDMHEEWFVPKEEVRDLLKENYALITKAKELLKQWVGLYKPKLEGYPITPIQVDTEQFLSEVDK